MEILKSKLEKMIASLSKQEGDGLASTPYIGHAF